MSSLSSSDAEAPPAAAMLSSKSPPRKKAKTKGSDDSEKALPIFGPVNHSVFGSLPAPPSHLPQSTPATASTISSKPTYTEMLLVVYAKFSRDPPTTLNPAKLLRLCEEFLGADAMAGDSVSFEVKVNRVESLS
jgi:hypothetical protein